MSDPHKEIGPVKAIPGIWYPFAVILVGLLMAYDHPLTVTRTRETVRTVHDTIALREDTIRVMERPQAFGSCALPAVVIGVKHPHHAGGSLMEGDHGHYKIAAGLEALSVVAVPAGAAVGDVVCIMGPE